MLREHLQTVTSKISLLKNREIKDRNNEGMGNLEACLRNSKEASLVGRGWHGGLVNMK